MYTSNRIKNQASPTYTKQQKELKDGTTTSETKPWKNMTIIGKVDTYYNPGKFVENFLPGCFSAGSKITWLIT